MTEIAFRVEPGCEFYKQYFAAKAERQKFHDCARAFFKNHNLLDSAEYYQTEFLALKLSETQRKMFDEQIKKYHDQNGMTVFKKKSEMQREWTESVVSKIDMELMRNQKFWYFTYVHSGSYSLWDLDGQIFGYLSDKFQSEIKLPPYFIPIKMSDYYLAMEKEAQ